MNNSIPIYRGENAPQSTSVIWLHHEVYKDTNSPLILSVYQKGKWSIIANGDNSVIKGFKYEVANELPEASASTVGVMYIVPSSSEEVGNTYDEFVTIDDDGTYSWEQVGSTYVDISTKEDISNKVTSVSSESTDDEYPSAKCLYDIVGDIETLLSQI